VVDWSSVDWNVIIQAILFGLFAAGTAILNAVIQPTYDNLVVPELSAPSLFPVLAHPGANAGFLSTAVSFNEFLVGSLVDPAIGLVLCGMAVLYLVRAVSFRAGERLEPLLPRLILAVLGANFTLPLAAACLDTGGAAFRLVSSFDGGLWRHWENLAPLNGSYFSWDNGVLAFVVTFALFALVLALATVVALRDAMIAVLLVLLPLFTLLWALPPLAVLARRGWSLLVELAFLPAVILVPLELAVGTSSILLLLAYLTIAVGSPYLISLSRAQLGGLGFPSAGSALTGGLQRGLAVGSLSAQGTLNGAATTAAAAGGAMGPGSVVRTLAGHMGRTPLPGGVALSAGHVLGQGSRRLLSHLGGNRLFGPSVPPHPARMTAPGPLHAAPGISRGP